MMSTTVSQNVANNTSQKITEDSSTEDDSDKMPEQQPGVVETGDQLAAVEPASEAPVPRVNDKHQLQDQTNLLPFKQVIVIFMGLSCALFCESDYFNLLQYPRLGIHLASYNARWTNTDLDIELNE